jgi:hypothetical protein
LEKIVLLCSDKEKHKDLEKCLEILFPECSLEVVEERYDSNFKEKFEYESIKGDI